MATSVPIKTVLIVIFLLGIFSSAQEIRRIDLSGFPQTFDPRTVASDHYLICSSSDAKNAARAVRVSVESITPTDIQPKQMLSVILKVENDGLLPVILPVSPDSGVIQPEKGSTSYHAILPVGAGVPSVAITLGWLHLYGSTSKSDTTVNLRPGEWLTVRGGFSANRWFNDGALARAYSDLQLYQPSVGANLDNSSGQCVRQVSGSTVAIRFKPLNSLN